MYRPTCSRFNSTYVGQTVRHLATRVDEHRKRYSPVGQHLLECNKEVGASAEMKSDYRSNSQHSEATHTRGFAYLEEEAKNQHTRRIQQPGINTKIIVHV